MTPAAAIVAALGALALVLAQEFVPTTPLYHTWQYAALVAATVVVLGLFAWSRFRAGERALALAAVGMLVIGLDGLTAGLIGPDTETIVRAPGAVQPLPDLKAAAFFAQADAPEIAAGKATVLIRRRGEADIAIAPGARAYLGTSILWTQPQRAAYIVAREANGDRLTVTQPTGGSFLSPVLLFPKEQKIKDKTYRYDQFALPAKHRVINALYFSAADLIESSHGPVGTQKNTDAVLFGVNDDRGGNVALGFGPSGKDTLVGDVHLNATLGTYPELTIASGVEPIAFGCGLALTLFALGWYLVRARGPRARVMPNA